MRGKKRRREGRERERAVGREENRDRREGGELRRGAGGMGSVDREREGIRQGDREATEGGIPGARRRRTRVEKRVRAAHYARDASPWKRARGKHAAGQSETRSVATTGRMEGGVKLPRGEGAEACATERRARERNPWKSRGERHYRATDRPSDSSARGWHSQRFPRGKAIARARESSTTIVARSACTSRRAGRGCVRARGENRERGGREREERAGPGRDAQGW